MKNTRAWAIQSFLICVCFNAILAGLIFMMADKIMDGLSQWVSPFLKPGAPDLPDDLRSALGGMGIFLGELRDYLAPALAALAGAVALLLWLSVFFIGRGHIARAADQKAASAATIPIAESTEKAEEKGPPANTRQSIS